MLPLAAMISANMALTLWLVFRQEIPQRCRKRCVHPNGIFQCELHPFHFGWHMADLGTGNGYRITWKGQHMWIRPAGYGNHPIVPSLGYWPTLTDFRLALQLPWFAFFGGK